MNQIITKARPGSWCPPMCEDAPALGARNLVSRNYILPQRSVASRFYALPQRSVVSRTMNSPCNCKNLLSELSDSYSWSDILDQSLTIQKPTRVYQLPDHNSEIVKILQPGDVIQIYSYVNNQGVTWLQFYTPPMMFPDWIPLSGSPGSVNTIPVATMNTIFDAQNDIPGLLTTEEKENQNNSWFDNAQDLAKNVLIGVAGLLILSKLTK